MTPTTPPPISNTRATSSSSSFPTKSTADYYKRYDEWKLGEDHALGVKLARSMTSTASRDEGMDDPEQPLTYTLDSFRNGIHGDERSGVFFAIGTGMYSIRRRASARVQINEHEWSGEIYGAACFPRAFPPHVATTVDPCAVFTALDDMGGFAFGETAMTTNLDIRFAPGMLRRLHPDETLAAYIKFLAKRNASTGRTAIVSKMVFKRLSGEPVVEAEAKFVQTPAIREIWLRNVKAQDQGLSESEQKRWIKFEKLKFLGIFNGKEKLRMPSGEPIADSYRFRVTDDALRNRFLETLHRGGSDDDSMMPWVKRTTEEERDEWLPSKEIRTPHSSCLLGRVEFLRMKSRANKGGGVVTTQILTLVLPTAEGVQNVSHGGALAGIVVESCLFAVNEGPSRVSSPPRWERDNAETFTLVYRRPVPLMRLLRVEVSETSVAQSAETASFRVTLFAVREKPEEEDLKCTEAEITLVRGSSSSFGKL